VAQLNLYVPDEIAEDLKTRAKASGKSLSSYVVEIIESKTAGPTFDWDEHFARLDRTGPVDIQITEKDRYFGDLRDINLD
jgi:hypothetical protein